MLTNTTPEEYLKSKGVWYGPGRVPPREPVAEPDPVPEPEPEPVKEPAFDVAAYAPPIPSTFPRRIVAEVAAAHGMKPKDILGARRSRPFVTARHAVICALADNTGLSLAGIGRLINKDHTTVLHALRKAGRL